MRKLALLLLCGFVLSGCSHSNSEPYEHHLFYPPLLENEPFWPHTWGCLKQMDKELPASPEAVEMFARFKGLLPKSSIAWPWDKDAAVADLMATPFSETEEFSRLVVACLLSKGTPVGEDMPGAFLQAFAFQCEHYSDAVILQMAEILYSGKLSWRLSPTDTLAFHFALVAHFGMKRVNECVERVYRENGQVLVPPVLFRGFVPSIIFEVAGKVKNAPPAEHKALLQSIAFAYTGRIMVPTETIREFYKAYPCRTYAHELVERGDFAVMADFDLWLNFRMAYGDWYTISPVLMFEHHRVVPVGAGEHVYSPAKWREMQQLGIFNPTDLAAKSGVTSVTDYYRHMVVPDQIDIWPRIPIHYREHSIETARLIAHFEKKIPIDSVPVEADLGVELRSYESRCTSTFSLPVEDLILDLMMAEGLVPCAYYYPYFACSYLVGFWRGSWHAPSWDLGSETNLALLVKFFGSELVWNEGKLQFDWKDPAKAAEITANGVR
ncbi:MAG: hypothetical protein WC712_04165 [Candidatus Brocadiia bacterium]